jgi:hypothetical protein
MKNTKTIIILCLILSLSVIGCSDFYNWAYVEEDQYVEENLDEREDEGEIEIDYENERKEYIDTDKDSELEKRDKAGNKTYWSNEQDPEF